MVVPSPVVLQCVEMLEKTGMKSSLAANRYTPLPGFPAPPLLLVHKYANSASPPIRQAVYPFQPKEQLALGEELFIMKGGDDMVVCVSGHWLICATLRRWADFMGMSNFRHFLSGSAGKLEYHANSAKAEKRYGEEK